MSYPHVVIRVVLPREVGKETLRGMEKLAPLLNALREASETKDDTPYTSSYSSRYERHFHTTFRYELEALPAPEVKPETPKTPAPTTAKKKAAKR